MRGSNQYLVGGAHGLGVADQVAGVLKRVVRRDVRFPSGLQLEAEGSCFWLSERVTGFPGLRPGQANPRMLAWE